MALTIGTPDYDPLPQQSQGKRSGFVNITFDSSYATGGEAIVYSDIPGLGASLTGLSSIASTHEEFTYQYDSTNGTIAVHAVGAEVAASVDLSGVTTKFRFYGS